MMRTIEVALVVFILAVAFILASFFAVLPSPRKVSALDLRQLALTTLEVLDAKGDLSETVFKPTSDPAWGDLERALAACLPPNIVYNLTVYDILNLPDGTVLYSPYHSISNAPKGLGTDSEASSILVASSNVTFVSTPKKVSTGGGNVTLYILNCEDANGWWITGYTGQSLAADLYNLLSPYFETVVLVNNTNQLGRLLDGLKLTASSKENVVNAVVINTFGEAVPIPADYCQGGSRQSEGYDSSHSSYAPYCYLLGGRVRQYNWTWVSIVGYPLFYVTNTKALWDKDNTYGIYGMVKVDSAGLNAFLRGLDGIAYDARWWDGSQWKNAWWQDQWGNWIYDRGWITSEIGLVQFTSEAKERSNYYGIYPASSQMASRALPQSIESTYHLTRYATIFEPKLYSGVYYVAVATFKHAGGGALTVVGLTRVPDIRISALALLTYYKPTIYKSEFMAAGTSRLVVLQLSQLGGG
jgi:hypothetical protein